MLDPTQFEPDLPIRIGISACLAGHEVRFDGGHKRSSVPHDILEEIFAYEPICPEVGIGLGTPRDSIRLVGVANSPRAVNPTTGEDSTDRLRQYASDKEATIQALDGYLLMKNSPSCGMERVRVYNAGNDGPPERAGQGIFASAVAQTFPSLPLEESGRLANPQLLENFAMRVFVHARWRKATALGLTPQRLIEFHSIHKYLVMAHSVPGYRRLGQLLGDLSGDLQAIAEHYFADLMAVLQTPASRGGHANVLSHLQGYGKRDLDSHSRQELAQAIDGYRVGHTPLLAPVTLLRHHLQRFEADYALSQIYLDPHPKVAGLRRDL